MATFAKARFDFAVYAAARPTYPRQLFDFISAYHAKNNAARWDTAVDLGCGTGQATVELTQFKHVVGVDPSQGMVDRAREVTAKSLPLTHATQFEYRQAAAEELPFLKDGSVDLMISAQAAHWFDWEKMWQEAARVIRPGGSFAFWIYSEFRLPQYPSLTPLITYYAQGIQPASPGAVTDFDTLGPYWEQPGRNKLVNHLLDVPDPKSSEWTDLKRVYFSGDYYPHLPNPLPPILRLRTTWAGLYGYLQTFSSLHTYKEKFPDKPNPSDQFFAKLMEKVGEQEGREVKEGDQLDVEWPVALCLARRT
ncbi:hypothetical protein OE88DRAFT_1631414 [Heliocybe sulcata]|uniref:Methyltransferase type 11 domain-containing protein n=1 Tax=Heliocybe sulcata TaxID=5364 RepID=A0A5C3N9H5_9AGAM|nr:hypothetical protein OE88DRAFT_1631414 [Heliocybe sulcata]